MTTEAQNLIRYFDSLQNSDKLEVAAEIIRRSLLLHKPPLSDEQLTAAAEEIFLEMDREESKDG
ncbi:MAG: hypothetical protein ACWGMZ_12555 [Thermoguttaceae bacterium]